jgi:hypothetical protein
MYVSIVLSLVGIFCRPIDSITNQVQPSELLTNLSFSKQELIWLAKEMLEQLRA